MAGVNKVILVGNLGKDPEVRYTQSGTAVATVPIAVSERRKEGDGWKDHTEWVNVVCFGKTAENLAQYMSKGRQLYVDGRMQTRKWTDKSGQDRWSTEVVANQVVFLGGRQDGDGASTRQGGGRPSSSGNYEDGMSAGAMASGTSSGGNTSNGGGDGFYDDDLPF